jgi:hypothetical protein
MIRTIIVILASLILAGCATPDNFKAQHLNKDNDFDAQQKLSGNLNEYSLASFFYTYTYGGDKISFDSVVRLGKEKLGTSRYMSSSIYFKNRDEKYYFDEKKLINQGKVYYGYSSLNQEDANKKSLEYCKIFHQRQLDFYISRNIVSPITECEIIFTYDFIKLIKNNNPIEKTNIPVRVPENEYERYLKQCEQIGFKRNTEKIGECALKIKDIEAKIQISNSQISNSQRVAPQSSQQQNTQITQSQNSSADTLANLVILNEAIKLMNPPKRNFNCQARPFGIYTNVYCN